MGNLLQFIWGKGSLKERRLRVAGIMLAIGGGTLEILGMSIQNNPLFMLGFGTFLLSLVIAVFVLPRVALAEARRKMPTNEDDPLNDS